MRGGGGWLFGGSSLRVSMTDFDEKGEGRSRRVIEEIKTVAIEQIITFGTLELIGV